MSGRLDQLSEVKRALLDLKEVRARFDELKRSRNEPIAIIGLGCRFPGNCHDAESYWRLLQQGGDTVREVPRSRWDIDAYYDPDPDAQGKMYTRYGSFLDDVDRFDAQFFGISPREATSMDPQHRLLLEVSWEALEHAGQSPARIKGSQTGVFIGITNNDYVRLLELAGPERIDAYHLTGTPLNFASGRLSYTLGLHGPSMAVDTACSSSLVAVHLACQSLRMGDCDLALAGGVNLVLSAAGYVIACRARMMARDGRCKTFDARADGFVRGEGCGVVVLKRLSDAVAARDHVLAVIRGSAVNQDGYSSGLTVPNKAAQEAVIRRALDVASVVPAAVGYVEAHGTGTSLGDPIELRALAAVLGAGRAADRPFAVGSVKTNIGHLESAAGIAGLIKVVLALQNEEIPKHLHFQHPNPNLDWSALPLYIPTVATSWRRGDSPRIAAISSFGGSGTNSHVVIEEAPALVAGEGGDERALHVLTLSAKSEAALGELVARYRRFLSGATASFADICYTANTGRTHFPYRLAIVARDAGDAGRQLAECVPSHATSRRAAPDSTAPDELAAAYCAGAEIDWEAFDRGYSRRKVVLPTYPFQREHFWIDTSHPEEQTPFIAGSSDAVHPVLGYRLESALAEKVFERRLAADSPDLLNDHRVYGTIVVPGAYYIAVMLSGAVELFGGVAHEVCDVTFSQALLIPDGHSCRLQVVLRRTEAGAAAFQIFSRDSAAVESTPWMLHAAGVVRVPDAVAPGERVSLHGDGETAESELFYRLLWESGIHLGATFRWVEQVWRREGEALGRMRLPSGRHESRDYVLYPGLIDSCFQVMAAALPDEGMGSTVYLPLGIGAFRVFGAMPARLWCRARVTEPFAAGSETCTGSLQLLDENGAVVAEIESLAVKRAPREVLLRSVRRPGEDWLYRLDWEPAPRGAAEVEADLTGAWTIVADGTGVTEELADLIRRHGGEVTAEYSPGVRGVVHLASLDSCDPIEPLACESVLRLVQAIAGGGQERPPQLWMVTRNAQAIPGDTEPVTLGNAGETACATTANEPLAELVGQAFSLPGPLPRALSAAPLWGLGRVIASEHPELRSCLIDLDGAADAFLAAAQVFEEIARPDGEDQIALRCGQRYAARLARVRESGSAGDGPVQLDITSRGTLENLQYRPTTRRAPGPHEIEIRVHATGLNFRDVLNALGMYPGNPGPLGGECSGVVSAVGEQVKAFAAGDEVAAIAPGSFGTFVTTPAALAVAKPGGMAFEEAAAIPMAYLTADYALHHLAGMTATDRVLIHAAAGGVGMAAVRLAQSCGAEIFATAGSDAKREFLRSLGVRHVMDSRSVAFASEIQALTGGRGVDVVLNSLAGEFIPKSLEALARGGRFLEIGKREIWTEARMRAARPDVAYHTIALDRMMIEEPEALGAIFRGIMKRIAAGSLHTIPVRAFPASEVQAAFRHMALARHTGKVVVSQAPAQIRGDGAYLITGGLGALGLRVAEWMAARGARHIVLAGRGEPSAAARTRIQEMEKGGAKVVTVRVDVASAAGMSAVFEQLASSLPPLRGIVHAAGVLDDGILLRQDWARFRQVLAPKVAGAWNLHELSRNLPLDFFVLFSSGAALLGSPGQGNYAAANAFLDALAHWRRAQGQTALSINWGPWSERGMGAGIQSKAMGSIPPDTGVEILERLLAGAAAQVAVLPLNLAYLGKHLGGHRAGLFANLLRDEHAGPAAAAAPSDFRQRLHSAAPEDRPGMMAQHVREEVMKVLGLEPAHTFDARQSFFEIGMDSLMAVEVRNRLQATLGVYLPSTLVFDYPSAESMTAYLLKQAAPAEAAPPADDREAELESLSEDQLEELLLLKLDSLQARSGQ